MDLSRFAEWFSLVYAGEQWPSPLRRRTGDKNYLIRQAKAVLKAGLDERDVARNNRTLGSLIIGRAAEAAFQELYSKHMETMQVSVHDDRKSGTDADFILRNGSNRDLYRMNIKLHGSVFRQSRDYVGLDPLDCFPLATYKISNALQKQDELHLPYLFVIVTVPGLAAEQVGQRLPIEISVGVMLAKSLISTGKRRVEELFLDALRREGPALFEEVATRLKTGSWYVISARRAHETMKAKLFERVFALRQRDFNRAFRNAEIDMHLSFATDMVPLAVFFERTRTLSAAQIYSMIERGTI